MLRPSWLSVAVVLAVPSVASAQQPLGSRGALVVYGPPSIPDEPPVVIEVDGRPIPPHAMGHPLPYPAGKKHVRAEVRDASGRSLVTPMDQIVFVHPNRTAEVYVPPAVSEPDTGLLAGGVTVTTLGVAFIVGSAFLFTLADGAGTDCHIEGFSTVSCGYEPAPYIGYGVGALLFGLGGIIGGPVMIAEGAEEEVSWIVPEVQVGPAWGGLRWTF